MNPPINWGIIGPGNIARKFALDLQKLPDAKIIAVASRSLDRAQTFAQDFGIPHVYDSYEQLAADAEVEVVYIASPHIFHFEHSQLCLEAGKAVLCEKPFTVNAQQSEALFALAQEKGRFIMEAMWTRFLPVIQKSLDWIQEGRIGTPQLVQADFGFVGTKDPNHRINNPALAGGTLLDIGIYPLTLAYLVFGEDPVGVTSHAILGPTGVDVQSSINFTYKNGGMAQLLASFRGRTYKEARIMGEQGYLRIPLFWRANEVTLYNDLDEELDHFEADLGLRFQAIEVMKCLREGQIESQVFPHAESLRVMRMMDRLRREWGVGYPGE